MLLLLEIIFGVSVGGLGYTYLFYPLMMRAWSRWTLSGMKKSPLLIPHESPRISVLLSAYREAGVIAKKIATLQAQDYPSDRITFWLGTDAPDDDTNALIAKAIAGDDRFKFYPFTKRRGKPAVINELAAKALTTYGQTADHLLVITDANVMLTPPVLANLARHFADPAIALVDAHMVHTGLQAEGISLVEDKYISGEVRLKHAEGQVWGCMMGPFGGCYAIRSSYFAPVQDNFLVDDFYIAMRALEQGGKAINDLDAICYEGVSHELEEEYRRKRRISAGNYQNLNAFRHLLWPPRWPLSFAFFSHKVLRWWGPWLLLAVVATSLPLSILSPLTGNLWLQMLFLFPTIVIFALPLIDFLAKQLNINILILRGVRYFVWMNIALLAGWWTYKKGIKSNVWEPPKREH